MEQQTLETSDRNLPRLNFSANNFKFLPCMIILMKEDNMYISKLNYTLLRLCIINRSMCLTTMFSLKLL